MSISLAYLTQELHIATIFNYTNLIAFTIVIYDWILTFPVEVRIMWKPPLTGAKVLFFLNRYIFIACYVSGVMSSYVSGANSSCFVFGSFNSLFTVLHNLVVSVFQILRVYAISGRRKRYSLLIGVFLVFAIFSSIYGWATSVFVSSPPPIQGCDVVNFVSDDTINTLNISMRVCLIVADAIMIAVTIHHTYVTVRINQKANLRSSFSSTVLNAGILYFSVMLLMNALDLIVQLTTKNDYFGDFPALFDYLMMSHFLLNLQELATVATVSLEPSCQSFVFSSEGQVSSIRFADRVIGNLGESLRGGSPHDDADDDADEDEMTRVGNIEIDLLPTIDEEPVHSQSPSTEDILDENVGSRSPLPLDDLRHRNTSELLESGMLV